MPDTDISSMEASNLKNVVPDFSVDSVDTDAPQDQEETTWQSTLWSKNLGYYKKIPELKVAIDTKATWTVGAGFEANEETTMILGTIKGNGKDNFISILKNMIRTKVIDGDAYAEIIRDDEGIFINLKPLDPSVIVSVWNRQGRIKRYEQTAKKRWFQFWKSNPRFKPEEIFHLSRDRIADEMHGISVIPAVEEIILMRNEAMADYKKLMHRNVKPIIVWHLDTDDVAEIAEFKRKNDLASKDGENIYVPKGVVEPEILAVAQNATLNPLPWIIHLNDSFFQVVNTPQIITGNAKEFTDASAKIVYLSYEQSVKAEQMYMEWEILSQLNLEIKLRFPASLQSDAVSGTPSETDTIEEEPIEEAAQENDTTEEIEGKT